MVDVSEAKTLDRKARLKIPPQPVPKQDPRERIRNWREVYLGFDLASARLEASRCLQCPAAPCQKACPLHNDIPAALRLLEEGDPLEAAQVFRRTNPLPDMCGRLCPQESLCEGACVVGKVTLPVAIGQLEAFVAGYQREHGGRPPPDLPPPTGKRVAVVGSGPAGLAVAEELAKRGHGVKVLEAWPRPGGVLRYGIPSFKMEKWRIDEHVDYLHNLGIQFAFNVRVGFDITVEELFAEGFHAVFLGHGAGQGNRLGIPGEELEGVYTATEFLIRANLPPKDLPPHLREPLEVGRRVVVIGGGDTAMDCVRSALRTGAREVYCVYRRTEAEMPGRRDEREHAKEEGVQFLFQTVPVRFIADEEGRRIQVVRLQRMELGPPDESGRPRPVPVIGSESEIRVDSVIIAIGYKVDRLLFETTPGLEATQWGTVAADPETGQTSRPGVFAAGDNVRGADLVVTALADAKRVAHAIHQYLEHLDQG